MRNETTVTSPAQGNDTTPLSPAGAISEVLAGVTVRSDEEMAEYAEAQRRNQRAALRRKLARELGERYADCTLAHFVCKHPEQRVVVERLELFGEKLAEHTSAGHGLILFGPVGTGKDHLMAALFRRFVAMRVGTFQWASGVELYEGMRDLIGTHDVDRSERAFVGKYIRPTLFALSDPIPAAGELTSFNAQTLYRIIDGRYRERRPTWITLNVATREEAEQRLTAPILDRLRHEATAVYCNWPSYRRPLGENLEP